MSESVTFSEVERLASKLSPDDPTNGRFMERYVVVVGVDGMSSEGVQTANTPNFDGLMSQGAYTYAARAVIPTSSSPNWASILMGAGPEQHGVTSNDWEPDCYEISPTVVGFDGMFPTIFGVLRNARPEAILATFYDWGGFGRLMEPNAPNFRIHTPTPQETVRRTIETIQSHKPHLTFLQLDHVDDAGHKHGWKSDGYYIAVEEADRLTGDILDALDSAGIRPETVVFVVSDHGGKGKSHGGITMEELIVPWMIAGPGIAVGREITTPVNLYDTAPTIARIFDVMPPEGWIGRPVHQAFVKG